MACVWFFFELVLISLFLNLGQVGQSMPIGFGYNQGEREYLELKTPHFYVYHHQQTPHEGAMVANALEAAKPVLDAWIGKTRQEPLPVVLSATSSNASFANFVTDALEIQTHGRGGRDLFWHEQTHETMYRYFDTIFGTAGAAVYLPWTPAWFIEGLAEALTMSLGSDVIASVERSHARTGHWPSYDRLFSIYGTQNSAFFEEGYATSGAFVSWMLKRGLKKNPDFLKHLLKRLEKYSGPKYYLWSFNPVSSFMPMKEALQKSLGRSGRSFYKLYQKEATAFWKGHKRAPLVLNLPGKRRRTLGQPLFVRNTEGLQYLAAIKGRSQTQVIQADFDQRTGWWQNSEDLLESISQRFSSAFFIYRDGLQLFVSHSVDRYSAEQTYTLIQRDPESGVTRELVDLKGRIKGLFETVERIYWVEEKFERTRVCYIPKSSLGQSQKVSRLDVVCPVQSSLPKHLELLGFRYKLYPGIAVQPKSSDDESLVSELFMVEREETLHGDRSRILIFDPTSDRLTRLNYNGGGVPRAAAVYDKYSWVLVRTLNRQMLKKLDRFGFCSREVPLADQVENVHRLDKSHLALTMKNAQGYTVRKVRLSSLMGRECQPSTTPSSPLMWAMGKERLVSLADALHNIDLWKVEKDQLQSRVALNQQKVLGISASLDRAQGPVGNFPAVKPGSSKPRVWRARPLFYFPWIGADDAQGTQFGLISVPLMDHLQNETVRGTALFGLKSKFPSTEIALVSHRFWPTWETSVFKRQVWDGNCRLPSNENQVWSSYFDDTGAQVNLKLPFFGDRSGVQLRVGVRASLLKEYINDCDFENQEVRLFENFASLSFRRSVIGGHSIYAEIDGKIAPEGMNEHKDYNVFSTKVGSNLSLPILKSRLLLSVSGKRTRGAKMFNLKEYYTPLKTFIAGSGGGYNQNSFSLSKNSVLFSPRIGDTKARLETAWSAPILSNVEKQVWLFYLDKLKYTAFYNYGGAWTVGRNKARERMVSALGNRLDLLFENKGVKFNASLGTGKVVGQALEVFVQFGFDAIL